MCDPTPLFQAFDSVGLSVCQLLYRVLNAILLVQVSSADVRQVSRLVENCSDLAACHARSLVAVSVVSPTSTRPEATAAQTVAFHICKRALGPEVRLLWNVLPDFLQLDVPLL